MTPELEQLMDARHKAFVEWDTAPIKGNAPREGLLEKFLSANRAYVIARDRQQGQIKSTANTEARKTAA